MFVVNLQVQGAMVDPPGLHFGAIWPFGSFIMDSWRFSIIVCLRTLFFLHIGLRRPLLALSCCANCMLREELLQGTLTLRGHVRMCYEKLLSKCSKDFLKNYQLQTSLWRK